MAPARRPSSGFPTDVRETDRLSQSGAGLCWFQYKNTNYPKYLSLLINLEILVGGNGDLPAFIQSKVDNPIARGVLNEDKDLSETSKNVTSQKKGISLNSDLLTSCFARFDRSFSMIELAYLNHKNLPVSAEQPHVNAEVVSSPDAGKHINLISQ